MCSILFLIILNVDIIIFKITLKKQVKTTYKIIKRCFLKIPYFLLTENGKYFDVYEKLQGEGKKEE